MTFYAVLRNAEIEVMRKRRFSCIARYDHIAIGDNDILKYLQSGITVYDGYLQLYNLKKHAIESARNLSKNTTICKKHTFYDGYNPVIHHEFKEVPRTPPLYLNSHPVIEVSLKDISHLKSYRDMGTGLEYKTSSPDNIQAIYSYTYFHGSFDNPDEITVVKNTPLLCTFIPSQEIQQQRANFDRYCEEEARRKAESEWKLNP